MALVRVCDRCESDDQKGMLTLSIGTTTEASETILRGHMSLYFKRVDFCSVCVAQLNKFIDGCLCIDESDEEETPDSESKKEKEDMPDLAEAFATSETCETTPGARSVLEAAALAELQELGPAYAAQVKTAEEVMLSRPDPCSFCGKHYNGTGGYIHDTVTAPETEGGAVTRSWHHFRCTESKKEKEDEKCTCVPGRISHQKGCPYWVLPL